MKYRITEAAYNDLSDIYFYTTEKWSEEQASKYFESIIAEIELFSEHPENAKQMSKVRIDFFYFRALLHYVFFKKNDDTIEVVRILHKMMDFSNHLE
ncbi:type II toxin-antitoxin system RelE/ParE family toxin [Flavobacterium sp.]|uniref:type II toxin-antitoxin system RelE/ParE family toxin n=1 Tax=Flavobacterium sp. TaxID=239 RepID=UPI0012242FEE|nr:type II toxin-antitoxin system RelE/ParE family toxin [Flavobacterium sp.]RZJ70481.1 MAG: type II toxin-antitoxin system RelE/ParE family toxin [Flavobacterium sp.]